MSAVPTGAWGGASAASVPEPGPETAVPHPEEMRTSLDLRIGNAVSLKAAVRTTPAGLVTAGMMASAVILSVAALVYATRRPRGW